MRYGLGAVMVIAGIIMVVINPGGFGVDGFAMAVGGGLSVLLINSSSGSASVATATASVRRRHDGTSTSMACGPTRSGPRARASGGFLQGW